MSFHDPNGALAAGSLAAGALAAGALAADSLTLDRSMSCQILRSPASILT
jgi:hypothetical protein